MAIDPQAEITELKGVGPALAQTLEKLGIFRLIDLLVHLPMRYQDRSKVLTIGQLRSGDEGYICGPILGSKIVFGRQRSLEVLVGNSSEVLGGDIRLRFFRFSKFQKSAIDNAKYIRAFGSVGFVGRNLAMAHPEYQTFDIEPGPPKAELTPVYPTTQGLGQQRLRNLAEKVCALPWPQQQGTPFEKLIALHQPTSLAKVEELQQDLALDELCAYYIVMKGRALKRRQQQAMPLPRADGLGRKLLDNLGFNLTSAQVRVVSETLTDLESTTPMLRLVQGDVGSGKTVVAAFAAIRAVEHASQAAVMAPTELLAEQHFHNFSNWLTPLGIKVTLLTGQMPAKVKRETLAEIADGTAQVIVGTHALFQDSVNFARLALVIIDEQHRFGVHQRMILQNKGNFPHQLVMTATPIPRTLTMTLYADMDVSVIDELPKGRQPITTHTVKEDNRAKVIEQVTQALKQGQQAYWVCTLIEDSDEIDAMSANASFEYLTKHLPKFRVGLLHGRMRGDEKVTIMDAFKAGEYDILVATTVVEVGVDVPNATHMVIENSERLGLAQLHQLRGRVGRGQVASRCFLLFKPGLSQAGQHRLNALRQSQDGFYLAEQDLKLRGPGDILGTRQAGEQSFKIADLAVHAFLMPRVIKRSESLMNAAPGSDEHDTLKGLLMTWAPADHGHLTV